MTEQIQNNRIDAATYKFGDDFQLDLDRLLAKSDKDEARISIDRDGTLGVVVPPRRRDNFLVAFFKGRILGNRETRAAYRKNERMLDNMDKLAKNLSFQDKLAAALMKRNGENGVRESKVAVYMLRDRLATYVAQNEGRINFAGLRNAHIQNANDEFDQRNATLVASYCNDPKLACPSQCDAGSVVVDGQPQGVFDFVLKHGEPGPTLLKDGQIDTGRFYQKIIARCLSQPEDFAVIGRQKEANELRMLLQDRDMSPKAYHEAMSMLSGPVKLIMDTVRTTLGKTAQAALDSGKSPADTAKMLSGMLGQLCGKVSFSRTAGGTLSQVFDPASIESKIREMPGEPPARPAALGGLAASLQKATGCEPNDAIRAAAFLGGKGIQEENISKDRIIPLLGFNEIRQRSKAHGVQNLIRELRQATDPLSAARLGNTLHGIGALFKGTGDVNYQRIVDTLAYQALLEDHGDKDFIRKNIRAINGAIDSQLELMAGRDYDLLDGKNEPTRWELGLLKSVMDRMEEILNRQFLGAPEQAAIEDPVREQMDKLFGNLGSMVLVSTQFPKRIAELCQKDFPDSADFAARYITAQVRALAGAKGGSDSEIEGYIRTVAENLRNSPQLRRLSREESFIGEGTQQDLAQAFIEDGQLGIKGIFMRQSQDRQVGEGADQYTVKSKVGQDGYHEGFDRDVKGRVIRRIAGEDIVPNANVEEMQRQARTLFESIVPASLRPFVSTALMQGGLPSVVPNLLGGISEGQQVKMSRDSTLDPHEMRTGEHQQLTNYGFTELSLSKGEQGEDHLTIAVYNCLGVLPGKETGVEPYADPKPIFVKNLCSVFTIPVNGPIEGGVPQIKGPQVTESTGQPLEEFKDRFA
ncbi:MAG: hypothetical protein K6A65_06440 [Succinivibrionaceae bacterium]|nr:hypothetical protein [Succinivibrionaceae bacterium]